MVAHTLGNESADLELELEKLLAQGPSELCKLEDSLFDELVGLAPRPIVLFGAGGLGKKTLSGLRKVGLQPVAFADNNRRVHGSQVEGLPVLSPEIAAKEYGRNASFIITIYMDSAPNALDNIRRQLSELGCRTVLSFVPLFWKYPQEFLPHYVYDLPHKVLDASESVRAVWPLLADRASQIEYLAQVRWRLDPDYAELPARATHELYFPSDLLSLSDAEVFIDCGGFDGDTIHSFIKQSGGRFTKMFSFEPDPINFGKLTHEISSLESEIAQRIDARLLAVGRYSSTVRINAQGLASSSINDGGEFVVQCESLDSILAREKATYIKMDIEGAEIDALQGAASQIRQYLPVLAISAYHHQDHLWNVPILINSFADGYKFYFRRHSHLILDDLVLYAIPDARIANAQKHSRGI